MLDDDDNNNESRQQLLASLLWTGDLKCIALGVTGYVNDFCTPKVSKYSQLQNTESLGLSRLLDLLTMMGSAISYFK